MGMNQTDPNQYFFDTEYSYMDTTTNDGGNPCLVFVYSYENHAEKIYITKDTIEHRFGSFDDKGTLWVDETLTYIRNGHIIDSLSQFAFLHLTKDTANFYLFGERNMSFAINKYLKNDELYTIKLISTYESKDRQLKIANDSLENHLISCTYSRPEISDNNSLGIIQQEAFFDREIREKIQSHLELIDDPRVPKISE